MQELINMNDTYQTRNGREVKVSSWNIPINSTQYSFADNITEGN